MLNSIWSQRTKWRLWRRSKLRIAGTTQEHIWQQHQNPMSSIWKAKTRQLSRGIQRPSWYKSRSLQTYFHSLEQIKKIWRREWGQLGITLSWMRSKSGCETLKEGQFCLRKVSSPGRTQLRRRSNGNRKFRRIRLSRSEPKKSTTPSRCRKAFQQLRCTAWTKLVAI